MPAVWPGSLPQKILWPGFEETFPKRAVRSPMDSGPGKSRPRFTAAPRPIRGAVRLDATQAQTLRDFHDTTLAAGALSFDWVHPVSGAAVTMRFTDEPRLRSRSPNIFEADLQLEILP